MADPDAVQQIVDQWASVRADLDASPILVVGRIARVHQGFEVALRPPFAAAGLSPGDFDVLAALRRTGRPHAIRPADLSRALLVTTGAITKQVDRLERQGHVRRDAHVAEDGRGTLVRLTARGRALVDRLLPVHLSNEDRLLSVLSATERATLARLLAKLDANVRTTS